MRITIDTDELGQLKAGLADSTAAGAPIDAGPAPIEHIRRMSGVLATTDGGGASLPMTVPEPQGKAPLNPLRAGAAASRGATVVLETPTVATDGGRAAHVADDKRATAGDAAPPPAKSGKPRGKR